MQNRPHSHLCMAELHKRPMRLKTMSAGFSVQMILQGNFTTHSNQALSLIFINHLWSTRCLRCWVLLDCCFGVVSTRMSRFLQPKCHFECLPDSQVYHFDRLLFTPGTCHSLWILRKSCPQIVCSQRIEGKNGGENHEVRVVNLAGGWSMITLQNGCHPEAEKWSTDDSWSYLVILEIQYEILLTEELQKTWIKNNMPVSTMILDTRLYNGKSFP